MDYFINVNIALAFICVFYFLVLKRSAYFTANRAFLLSGLGLVFIIPALRLPADSFSGISPREVLQNVLSQPAAGASLTDGGVAPVLLDPVDIEARSPAASSLTGWEWTGILYSFIAFLFLLKNLFFLYQLLQLYRKNPVTKRDGYRLVLLENSREPAFSFFSTIFLNSTDLQRKDNWILRHELVHVKQWHSLDILLSEIVKAILWINPFVYLYQRALRSVNEYLADAIVPQEEKSGYARLMYDYSFRNTAISLQNSFFNKTLLKRRINMLYQKKTRKMRAAYLLVIPMLVIVAAFTVREEKMILNAEAPKPHTITVSGTVTDLMNRTIAGASIFVKGTPQGTSTDLEGRFKLSNIPSDSQLEFNMIGYEPELVTLQNNSTVNVRMHRKRERLEKMVINAYVSSAAENKQQKAMPEHAEKPEGPVYSFASIEKMPSFPGGNEKLISYIGRRFNYPKEAREKNVEGLVEIGFIVDEEGNVTQPEILKGIGAGCDEEALRIIKKLPQWEPGEQNGVKVAVYYVLPLNLNIQ